MSAVGHPIALDPLIAEAKERARRRRLIAAGLIVLAAAGIAAGVLSVGRTGGPSEIPWLPTKPQLPAANPPLAPACAASQLAVTVGLQGGDGALYGALSIRNRGTRPCALVGDPRLSFLGATSAWRVTKWTETKALGIDPLAPPLGSLRALTPGRWVHVNVFWSNWCGRGARYDGNSGQPPAGLVLAAPGGGRVVLRTNLAGGQIGAPPCYTHAASKLQATRFSPFVPQGPPSSALPLKASVVPTPGRDAKGRRIGVDPVVYGHAGSWLSYTVVLTNTNRRPFHFGRTCPAYSEGIGALQNQAYVLNCHAVDSIPPHGSARFAMRVHVPTHVTDLEPLGWTLAPHSWNAPQTLAVVALR